jgi:DNA-binding response OmpR family regulator|tara:strand:+ start:46706 stop:47098 length:393 start_codon:yes stop_codon:yes gene_type:complete
MRVLIVEDEFLVAMEMESILENNGIAVSGCASNIAEAQNIVRERECNFALVDINLADGDSGLSLAGWLAEQNIPSLHVSGNCPADRDATAAVGCLQKPFSPRDLIGSLKAVHAKLADAPPKTLPTGLALF